MEIYTDLDRLKIKMASDIKKLLVRDMAAKAEIIADGIKGLQPNSKTEVLRGISTVKMTADSIESDNVQKVSKLIKDQF